MQNPTVLTVGVSGRENTGGGRKVINESNWIPVSERLPEEHDTVFAKFKDTNKWNFGMFATSSNEVIVTAEPEFGKRIVTTSKTHDGEWWCEKKETIKKKVIAWKPLPEPYMR